MMIVSVAYLLLSQSLAARQVPLDAVPSARFERMTRGMNLGGWFAQRERYDENHFATFYNAEEIALLSQWNLRHVRLPFDPDALGATGSPLRLDPRRVRILRETVARLHRQGLFVILDFHPNAQYKEGLTNDQDRILRMRDLWRLVATEFRTFSPESIAFEVLNEPEGGEPSRWWNVQRMLIREIRALAPTHTVIAGGNAWNSIEGLITQRPYEDRNVVYNFHFYEPFIFTHLGAEYMPRHIFDWRGVRYPSDPATERYLETQANTPEKRQALKDFRAQRWDFRAIRQRVKLVGDWGRQHRVRVTCNEFGSVRRGVKPGDRAAWVRDTREALEAEGIGWTFWDFRGGFGLFFGADEGKVAYVDVLTIRALGLDPNHLLRREVRVAD